MPSGLIPTMPIESRAVRSTARARKARGRRANSASPSPLCAGEPARTLTAKEERDQLVVGQGTVGSLAEAGVAGRDVGRSLRWGHARRGRGPGGGAGAGGIGPEGAGATQGEDPDVVPVGVL